jgi:hypothetical protein
MLLCNCMKVKYEGRPGLDCGFGRDEPKLETMKNGWALDISACLLFPPRNVSYAPRGAEKER